MVDLMGKKVRSSIAMAKFELEQNTKGTDSPVFKIGYCLAGSEEHVILGLGDRN